MEKFKKEEIYDPYNPNDLDDAFKEIENNKKAKNECKTKHENIGQNILKKMGWKGKGITI